MAKSPMGKGMSQLAEKMKEVQGFPWRRPRPLSMMRQDRQLGRGGRGQAGAGGSASVFAIATGYKKVPTRCTKMK